MQVQDEFAFLVQINVVAMIYLRANDHPRVEVEAVVMDRRMLEAGAARQFRMPYVQALVTLELDLHESEPVKRDFVGHYVINDHGDTPPADHRQALMVEFRVLYCGAKAEKMPSGHLLAQG